MISLSSAQRLLPPGPLKLAGGFLWWYLDMVDEDGNGLVLIWSYGLPFLPGIAAAARAGRPQQPAAHPSVNIVLYRDGRPDFYLFQTVDPEEAVWDTEHWKMGGLSGRRIISGDRLTLWLDLHCPVPGSSEALIGTIALSGRLQQGDGDAEADPAHEWCPMVVASVGTADLRCGEHRWNITGRAYHDRNIGRRPLHELGIKRWWWLRLAMPDHELIGYHLIPHDDSAPRSISLTIDAEGAVRHTEDARFVMSGWRRSVMGLSWPTTLTLTPPDGAPVAVRLAHRVDDGPFYQRFQIEAEVDGQRVRGFAEQVVPDRIDQAWMRPLVRMRVHRHDGDNSMWLPLFTGPRAGRLSRLIGLTPTRQLPEGSSQVRSK